MGYASQCIRWWGWPRPAYDVAACPVAATVAAICLARAYDLFVFVFLVYTVGVEFSFKSNAGRA